MCLTNAPDVLFNIFLKIIIIRYDPTTTKKFNIPMHINSIKYDYDRKK
jgi:hypothetical protein